MTTNQEAIAALDSAASSLATVRAYLVSLDQTTPTPAPSPVPSKTLTWDGSDFTNPAKWAVGRSSAYPGGGPTNPGDNKLDYIAAGNGPSAAGVFTADKRPDGKWNTDLVTTEYVTNGFELLRGDSVVARCTLNAGAGAWPAIWTWGRDLAGQSQAGHGEVDLFEYHPDNPRLLELTNHVGGAGAYVDGKITQGVPFYLQVDFGASSVDWWVDGVKVYADGKGVPSSWRAWPIVNISVCAGQYHPAPASTATHLEWRCESFRVYR